MGQGKLFRVLNSFLQTDRGTGLGLDTNESLYPSTGRLAVAYGLPASEAASMKIRLIS